MNLENAKKKIVKINDDILEFLEIVHVDGKDGNDTNGDGSKEKPFKTLDCGMDFLNTHCMKDGAIILKEGSYDVNSLFLVKNNLNLDTKYKNMRVTLIANIMGEVELISNEIKLLTYKSDTYNTDFRIDLIGIRLKADYIHLTGAPRGGTGGHNGFYNCLINGPYGGFNGALLMKHCLFVGEPNPHYVTHPSTGQNMDSASTTDKMDPANGNNDNCLRNVTVDSKYNITSQGWKNTGTDKNPDGSVAHIGVYGGQCAWGSKIVEEDSEETKKPHKLAVNVSVGKTLQLRVSSCLETPESYMWVSTDTRFAKVDQSGLVTGLDKGLTAVKAHGQNADYSAYVRVV